MRIPKKLWLRIKRIAKAGTPKASATAWAIAMLEAKVVEVEVRLEQKAK